MPANGPTTGSTTGPGNGQTTNDELDERARKRMAVGLAPNRPTAKAAPVRPPDYQALPLPPVVLALLLVTVVLVTMILLAANLSGGLPSWWPEWTGLAASVTRSETPASSLPPQTYELRMADDFSHNSSPLMQGNRPNEWRTELRPSESVYAIEVAPNHLAWSLLGLGDLQDYRLQTSVLVDAETPGGSAGLIVRYQDERHFYLLSVDGNGRYQIQQQDGDEVFTVQPWVMAPFLNRAGSTNLLTIEDDGRRIRFYGNNMLLAELDDPAYPVGFVGLAAGATGQALAEVRFDWFQLYDAAADAP
jgi:hypothetical protein